MKRHRCIRKIVAWLCLGLAAGGWGGAVCAGRTPADSDPVAHLTIYLVVHSHLDIGYTETQPQIEDKQVENLLLGLAEARRTAGYPEGARFVYNLEAAYPADLLLRRLGPDQRRAFVDAVRQGQVALSGMYTNTLTGLCRPEELVQLFRCGTRLGALTGVPVDTAMLTDNPAASWSVVPALAQAGIRYLAMGPNHGGRLGGIHTWDDRPFWWMGPAGDCRVLVWYPIWGYGYVHRFVQRTPDWVDRYLAHLRQVHYPYDISYISWAGDGDNAAPDPTVADFVRRWNAAHRWPHFVISSAHDAFVALERRYGTKLPVVRGDLTPYWEDGAGSTARETAQSRASSDRLAQAAALWAMLAPAAYPAADFERAMRLQLLFDEHSGGAKESVTEPLSPMTLKQWSIKQAYAGAADYDSRDLLSRAEELTRRTVQPAAAVDVLNTNSWARTDLVVLPKHLGAAGNRVEDAQGDPVPSQRLSTGELAFLARDVPGFASRRYAIGRGRPDTAPGVSVTNTRLDNGLISVALDPATGDIAELHERGLPGNLVDGRSGAALNQYLYFTGVDATAARTSGPVTLRVVERGPLVATIEATSAAPGCHLLRRRITLVAGQDYVDVADLVDKQRIIARQYSHVLDGKESVNFGFPFNVPGGQVRLEIPFGIVRPDLDQIPGANKNWFTIDRWADVSNADFGVTWISVDTPLVEVGGLTANVVAAEGHKVRWRREVGPTQKLYAWVMNNQWNTNYRAYQAGPVTFRFRIRPHRTLNPAAATRLAVDASQPLLAVRAAGPEPAPAPRLTLDTPDLVVTGFTPSDDGRALIVRVWNATDHPATSMLHWGAPAPRRVSWSDTAETARAPLAGPLSLPPWGLATLRADLE
ncbi:MAG TPA: glycoside hydrolase family 38 C-terminal domain-containing protein [Opitutaceae bacterium]|nr:glycoside hydrolase family 38 C-terminal domain-containing protein [Opitutaceae bacterium]